VTAEEIRVALTEWLDDAATNPMTGAPFVVAKVDANSIFDYLIGSYRGGEAPEHGVRSYLVDLKLTLGPEQSEAQPEALRQRSRHLPHVKVGRGFRFTRAGLAAWVEGERLSVDRPARRPGALLLGRILSLWRFRGRRFEAIPGLDIFAVLFDVLDKPPAALIWRQLVDLLHKVGRKHRASTFAFSCLVHHRGPVGLRDLH
jgi:hypothetical protein